MEENVTYIFLYFVFIKRIASAANQIGI